MIRLFGASACAVLLCATPLFAQTRELSRSGDAVLPISSALWTVVGGVGIEPTTLACEENALPLS
jgi:hypothetical protein